MQIATPVATGSETRGGVRMSDQGFRSVQGALRFAYRIQSKDIVKISSYFKDLRGSTVKKMGGGFGPWDAHAQAAMILAFVDRHLKGPEKVAVQGFYTLPTNPVLEIQKQNDCLLLVDTLPGNIYIPFWYAADVIREWAGYRRDHTDSWWARHLGVHQNTLYYWRNGRGDRSFTGIIKHINAIQAAAEDRLLIPMEDTGLITHPDEG